MNNRTLREDDKRIMSKSIELAEKELWVLKILCYAEFARLRNAKEHAHSHGDIQYKDSRYNHLSNIIRKLDSL